jgi:hypothetical protein
MDETLADHRGGAGYERWIAELERPQTLRDVQRPTCTFTIVGRTVPASGAHERETARELLVELASSRAGAWLRREQPREIELDLIQRADARPLVVLPGADAEPSSPLELESLDVPPGRIDEPIVGNAGASVQCRLLHAIPSLVGRRYHLTDPVGDNAHGSLSPRRRQPLSTPTHQIRSNDLVRSELDIDLTQDPPTARAATAIIIMEGPSDVSTERSLRQTVLGTWRGLFDQLAREDLVERLAAKGGEVRKRGAAASWR